MFLRERDVQSWPEYIFHALKVPLKLRESNISD